MRPRTWIIVVGAVWLGCARGQTDGSQRQTEEQGRIAPLKKTWERAIPSQHVPKGLRTLRASECGECHGEIYAEWRASTHAKALHDPQFQAEWNKDQKLFVCRNCHTPLQNQQETVVTGLVDGDYHRPASTPNPDFDAVLQEEAITCAACHVRDGFVLGPYGDTDAPHATRRAPEALSAQACTVCHNVQDVLSATLVCTFATGDEWRASPYPARGEDCITCHMPEVERPLAEGYPRRRVHRHLWAGGGIAKFPGEEAAAQRAFRSGLEVTVSDQGSGPQALLKGYAPGDTARFSVTVENAHAGHHLPTGDVERFVLIEMKVVDDAARVLKQRKERIGEVWEWWPTARKVSDNSLAPLEKRTFDFTWPIPPGLHRATFTVVVSNHRMTGENAKAMGVFGRYPLSMEVLRVERALNIQ